MFWLIISIIFLFGIITLFSMLKLASDCDDMAEKLMDKEK